MAVLFFEARHSKTFISLIAYICLTVIGIATGLLLLLAGGREVAMTAQLLVTTSPTFALQLLIAFFPLALTFLAIRQSKKRLLMLLILFKTVLFSFTACAVFAAFPNAGWLVHSLMLFPEWFGICVYHWTWMRYFVFKSCTIGRDLLICACFLFLAILFDYLLLCPFTASLFYT